MEDELGCHFYFGNKIKAKIPKIDYSIFAHPPVELKTIWFFNRLYWITGAVSLLFKPYRQYILVGEIHSLSNWVMLIMARVMGKKTYVWSHGFYGKESGTQIFIKKLYFKLATGSFLYGERSKQLMIKYGFDQRRLHVIYNSLDYDKTVALRKELQLSDLYHSHFLNTNPVIVFIGRLAPVKKLDMLLQALIEMQQTALKVNLVIVGDGTEKEHLEKMVDKNGLQDNVWFYGPSYDEKVTGELIYNADLCVSPGNVGLTAIHALSYGTPVITHNNFSKQMPEFEAMEAGISGQFFEEGNAVALKDCILTWLKNHPRKDEALITSCYSHIDGFYNPAYQIKVLKQGLGV